MQTEDNAPKEVRPPGEDYGPPRRRPGAILIAAGAVLVVALVLWGWRRVEEYRQGKVDRLIGAAASGTDAEKASARSELARLGGKGDIKRLIRVLAASDDGRKREAAATAVASISKPAYTQLIAAVKRSQGPRLVEILMQTSSSRGRSGGWIRLWLSQQASESRDERNRLGSGLRAVVRAMGTSASGFLGLVLRDKDADVRAFGLSGMQDLYGTYDQKGFQTLALLMVSDDRRVREEARGVLATWGLGSLQPRIEDAQVLARLTAWARGADSTVRDEAMIILGAAENPEAADALAEMLESADAGMRLRAAYFLARRRDKRGIGPLVEAFKNGRSVALTGRTGGVADPARGLGLYGADRVAIEPLVATIDGTDSSTTRAAGMAVGQIVKRYLPGVPDRTERERLFEALKGAPADPAERLDYVLAACAKTLDLRRATDDAIRMIANPSELFRYSQTRFLGACSGDSVEAALKGALKDPSPIVRHAAEMSLAEIAARNASSDPVNRRINDILKKAIKDQDPAERARAQRMREAETRAAQARGTALQQGAK